MKSTQGPRALLALAVLLLGGCYSNHFESNPTPNNFAADAVQNTVTTVALVPVMVLALPLMAVGEITEAIATPAGCDPCRADPCRVEGACPICGDEACDCAGEHDADELAPPAGRAGGGRGPGY